MTGHAALIAERAQLFHIHIQHPAHFRVPFKRSDIHQKRAAAVGSVGNEFAGHEVDHIIRYDHRLIGAVVYVRTVFAKPCKLRSGEHGVHGGAAAAVDFRVRVVQTRADSAVARILPHDEIGQRPPVAFHHRGRGAERRYGYGVYGVFFGERPANLCGAFQIDVRILFDVVFPLVDQQRRGNGYNVFDLPFRVKKHAPHTRRADVQYQYIHWEIHS